jgi:hypothetical protein
MRLLPLVLSLTLLAAPASAAEIGRLFFTPEQRASLDVARTKRARTAVATEPTDEAPAPAAAPAPEVVTYRGMVRSSDGKTTVWINNRALSGKGAVGGAVVSGIRPDGTVTVQAPQTGRNVSLKIGQKAELLSGSVEEGYLSRPARSPEAPPEPAAAVKPAVTPPAKPAANATAAVAEADRSKEEREQREDLHDAIRALRDAVNARSAETPPPQPGAAPAAPPYQAMPR